MSFRLIHASGNQFDTDSHRRAMYPSAAAKGDVFTTGEANKDHTTLKGIAGFDSVIYSELGIAWRRTKFDLLAQGARLVMPGGKNGARGSSSKDKRRRGPNRYALVAALREKATGQVWIVATHHAVAKADTSAKWRRSLRAQGFTGTAAFVAAYRKRYPTAKVVLTGDWNTVGTVKFPGLVEVKTPATFGRARYDRVHVSADTRATGVAKFATVLDHDGLTVNLAAVGATPTPAPIPTPAPAPKPTPTPAPPKEGPVTYEPPAPPVIFAKRHGSATNKPIKRIVIHCTAGAEPKKGGARETAVYFTKTDRAASAHYVVDPYETVQCVYDSVQAYHAPPNQHSLGIELCCSLSNQGKGHWDNDAHQTMLHRAARLVAELCLAYDIPAKHLSVGELKAGKTGICGHVDVSNAWHQTTHWDPGPHFPWSQFIGYVTSEITTIKKGATVPTSKPKNKVQTGRQLIEQGVKLLHEADAGSDRPAVENMADGIDAQLSKGPKS